ncbi:MAG: sigma-70 family RNA polymerase sigma factor [Bacteroidetes bacterium]|jgi:RNA polymerase sigma factor (TIGR02999 family)|nr:sigma-70 family RNA polymerase sigma factor [Bacteroidota bacterium]
MSIDVTQILSEVSGGSDEAYNRLFTVVYDQLRDIANRQLVYERKNHTFSKTDLVHEVFLKMTGDTNMDWKNRAHFYGVAALCMKQLLVDYARKRLAQKRGGDLTRKTYIEELIPAEKEAEEMLSVDDALEKLRKMDSRMAKVVDYRFFGGLTIKQTAKVMGISKNTVSRDWAKARGLLYKELKDQT